MNKIACKTILVVLLLSLVHSLTVGSLNCCPDTYVFDRDTLTCLCPSEQYTTSSGQCVACNSPYKWDVASLTCVHCPAGQTEDASGVCICPRDTPYFNGTACTACPLNLPIWNGKKCVACPASTHYDIASKTCTVCP